MCIHNLHCWHSQPLSQAYPLRAPPILHPPLQGAPLLSLFSLPLLAGREEGLTGLPVSLGVGIF